MQTVTRPSSISRWWLLAVLLSWVGLSSAIGVCTSAADAIPGVQLAATGAEACDIAGGSNGAAVERERQGSGGHARGCHGSLRDGSTDELPGPVAIAEGLSEGEEDGPGHTPLPKRFRLGASLQSKGLSAPWLAGSRLIDQATSGLDVPRGPPASRG